MALLVLFGGLLVAPYTFLPGLFGALVAHDLQARMGLKQTPAVELHSDPAYAMLLGHFSSGKVEIHGAAFGNVRARRVEMKFGAFDLDLAGSLLSGRLEGSGPLTGGLRVTLSEGEIRRIADSGVGVLPVEGIDLRSGAVEIESRVVLVGVVVPVSVVGPVAVRDGRIVFSPRRVSALGLEPPRAVARSLLSRLSFFYPVRDLPFPIRLTGIEVHPDDAVLRGRITIPSG